LQPDPASEIGELLNHIQDAAGSMQRLVESLLRHAQAGNEDVCREVFSVAEAVNAVETILSSLIVETGTQIECGPLPNLYADRTQFEQLLQNLLSNAIRYRRPGVPPRISISAGPVNAGWQFAIADNGEGIAPEHTRGIFEPLKRLHGHEIPGSGVGLALCRAIVERHGGKIWAESRGPGCGSTFRFIIPKD
jgi:signal transduction histidine kinase